MAENRHVRIGADDTETLFEGLCTLERLLAADHVELAGLHLHPQRPVDRAILLLIHRVVTSDADPWADGSSGSRKP